MVWTLGHALTGRGRIEYLYMEQGGQCVVCQQSLRVEEQPWHLHPRRWRCFGGQDTFDNPELWHAHGHRQSHAQQRS